MTSSVRGTVSEIGGTIVFLGAATTDDNDVVIETGDISQFNHFSLGSTAGAMDVLVSLDGTNFLTAPLSLDDHGGVARAVPVLVTVANRLYTFSGIFRAIRVLQNGVTDTADATLLARRDAPLRQSH